MIGELDEQQIVSLLEQQVVGRIGCTLDDFVYIVPTSYAYSDGYIYISSHEGVKLDVMRKNANVCFEVDNIIDMANWQSAIVWGKFDELKEKELRKKGLRILLNRRLPLSSSITTHLGSLWPFSEDDLDEITGVVFRIAITKKTGRFERFSYPPTAK